MWSVEFNAECVVQNVAADTIRHPFAGTDLRAVLIPTQLSPYGSASYPAVGEGF